jgi:hypothetical protein
MEKIVADLDFHGCLLRGARPNRILNRYDRKRERDRGQSAFCVPINHFSPPPYPMNRSPSSWSKPFPILDHPHHMGNDQSSCVKECRGHCYIQTDPLPVRAILAPDDQPDAGGGSVAQRHRRAGLGLQG